MSGASDDNHAPDLEALESALGHRFHDRSRLEHALCHSSYANEHRGLESNERLEFLGDSVVGLAVAGLLFGCNPSWREGDLSLALHRLVDRTGLADLARQIGLGPHLRLGRTEIQSGGAEKDSILADAMEAVIAAIYLDGGFEPVVEFVQGAFGEALTADAKRVQADPKTRFQEQVMARRGEFPRYRLVVDSNIEGDDERYTVEVLVDGHAIARGVGRTKQAAEKEAASNAIPILEAEEPADG